MLHRDRFLRHTRLALVVIAATLGPMTPAAAANREHQQILADIRMLQEQNQQLQLALANLTGVLRAITTRLDAQSEADRKTWADHRLLMDGMATELRIVREKLDDTKVRLSSLSQEVEALRAVMPTQWAPPAGPPPEGGSAATPAEAAPAPPVPNPAAGLSPQRTFEQAYADYASGQWSLAIAGFDTFLKTFPRSELADKAQRYIGESYLLDGKYEQAIAAYDKVLSNYPGGAEVPLALYKKGLAHARLNQNDRAREAWDTVVKRYPETEEAILARQGLDRLARPGR
jgi:tol-pal system protein YbgF